MKRAIQEVLYPSYAKRRLTFLLFDVISFITALALAFNIRYEFDAISKHESNLMLYFVVFTSIKVMTFFYFKLYDITWRFVSLPDLANIAKACLISSGILAVLIYGFNIPGLQTFPRSVLIIDLFLSFLFSSAFKISKRMYLEVMRTTMRNNHLKRTLIVGAGNTGEQILRDLNRSQKRLLQPVGFVDDNPLKQNLFVQGLRVLGNTDDIPYLINQYSIESIIIAVLTVDRVFHKKILNLAREAGVTDVKVVSTINDISNSVKVHVQDIRDIDVSDLIGRQAVAINTKIISSYIQNKRVLITGAAGSIGAEISRQVIFYAPSQIAILDINESDLADLELQLKRKFKTGHIKMYLCDVSNRSKVEKIFAEFRPDVVFHAAAYKHVPVMEKFPEEAVRVNITGTYNLAMAAIDSGVENFILISTDKAVNPTSIMGASKRIAEHIVTGAGKGSSSNFVAVRFGNVIGSRGSVLPIFIEQLKNGGPITVTHPEMKRYFMTIPEAVALVLQAAATGKNGDVFVLDMGEPIKIVDFARDLIMLNNLIPDKDIKIEYTGMREGEKLFEEILTAEEGVIATTHDKIFKARMMCIHNLDSINSMIEEFRSLSGHSAKEDWLALFKFFVPTFRHSSAEDRYNFESEKLQTFQMPVKSKVKGWG